MTREEARKEMEKGNKVTHLYMEKHEYLELESDVIKTEDGHTFTDQFNKMNFFSEDWTIFKVKRI